MNCERCGNEIADTAVICPSCGTAISSARASGLPPTNYGANPSGGYGGQVYEQGYGARPDYMQQPQPGGYMPPPQPGYMPPPQQNYGYAPSYGAPQGYPPGYVNVTVVNQGMVSNKNTGALIAEIILSLFGIYGVGWLMAGETTVGVVLLICSVFYWVFGLVFVIITLGIGLLCLGPLAIAAIVVNAILLNNRLNRKAAQFAYVQPQQMPPQWRPQ